MKTTIKYIFGSIGALVFLWFAVTIYGLVAAYLPIPRSWWGEYQTVMSYVTKLISLLPVAFVGALASRMLFRDRSALWSLACFLTAFVINFVPIAFESIELLGHVLRLSLDFTLTFVVGVPSLVFILERRHANKLSEPTP
jgi:hypothetical protein